MSSSHSNPQALPQAVRWQGLGAWNLYFIAKLLLYWAGALNFHAFYNLVFAAVLLLPLRWRWMHLTRTVIAIPVAIALLYHDTWFPPFSRLLAQPEVLQFSADYLLELLGRFINWDMVGAGVILLVAYLYLSQYLRFTVISLVCLALVMVYPYAFWPFGAGWTGETQANLQARRATAAVTEVGVQGHPVPASQGRSEKSDLNLELDDFLRNEKTRRVSFPAELADSEPFDVLFLNICSLSWADLRSAQLDKHPIWQRMDVIFEQFNSATSYSGPAVIRLLRASCGQSDQAGLYEPADEACYLFQNLQKLGFESQLALNHDGGFQGFLGSVQTQGNIADVLVPSALKPRLHGFDASPIWGDLDTLSYWWQQRQKPCFL